MAKAKEDEGRGGKSRPDLTPATETARRVRAARLAAELRANLARRKADLAGRRGDGESGELPPSVSPPQRKA